MKHKKSGKIGKLDIWYGHYDVIDPKFLETISEYNSLKEVLEDWEDVDD